MKRFTKNIIFNFYSFNKIKINNNFINNQRSPLTRKIAYKFSKQNISSREIDIKINEERWKNLQNNYKALKTSFGLVVPKEVSKDYPKPDRILYNLQALRQCSNQYPEYLLQELKNNESRFYEVIDKEMGNLWRAQKKQALQMIQFLIHWKIYQKTQQFGQMLYRTIQKMDLNLFQIFQLLKTIINQQHFIIPTDPTVKLQAIPIIQRLNQVFRKIFVCLQNKIIQRFDVIDSAQYEPLFKIINLFRLYDVYPEVRVRKAKKSGSGKKEEGGKQQTQGEQKEQNLQEKQQAQSQQISFYEIIQKHILKNLNQIPPSSLTNIAVHYANNIKQDYDQKIDILQKLQQRIIFNLKFLNHQQLIAILYSYIKISLLNKKFIEQFVTRIRLIYNEMSWQNKKKILAISSSFPKHQKSLIIAQAHNQLFKGKPVITKLQDGSFKKQFNPKVFIEMDYQLVPEIYLASYENNLLTEELAKKMQDIILNNVYNLDREEIVRSVWLFTITPNINNNLERLHKKLEVIIEGGFQGGEYSIKDISILVWSLCNSGSNNQQIYKPQAAFWNNIEFYLQQKLQKLSSSQQNQEISPISQCSSILWAYTFNRPLKFKTVSLITDIILQSLDPTKPPNQTPQQNLLQSFQLINIITFYYSLPPSQYPPRIISKIKQICVINFQKHYSQMNSLQLMKCMKYLTAEEYQEGNTKIVIKIKVWEDIVEIFALESQEIEYEHIMGIVGLLINSPLGRAKDKRVVSLVNKLLKRKKALEQIKKVEGLSQKAK